MVLIIHKIATRRLVHHRRRQHCRHNRRHHLRHRSARRTPTNAQWQPTAYARIAACRKKSWPRAVGARVMVAVHLQCAHPNLGTVQWRRTAFATSVLIGKPFRWVPVHHATAASLIYRQLARTRTRTSVALNISADQHAWMNVTHASPTLGVLPTLKPRIMFPQTSTRWHSALAGSCQNVGRIHHRMHHHHGRSRATSTATATKSPQNTRAWRTPKGSVLHSERRAPASTTAAATVSAVSIPASRPGGSATRGLAVCTPGTQHLRRRKNIGWCRPRRG